MNALVVSLLAGLTFVVGVWMVRRAWRGPVQDWIECWDGVNADPSDVRVATLGRFRLVRLTLWVGAYLVLGAVLLHDSVGMVADLARTEVKPTWFLLKAASSSQECPVKPALSPEVVLEPVQ